MTVRALIDILSKFDETLLISGEDDCGWPEEIEISYHPIGFHDKRTAHVKVEIARTGWYESGTDDD